VHLDKTKGTKVPPLDVAGDCMQWICDGKGHVALVEDTDDTPWSNEYCFAWKCVGWTPVRETKLHANCLMDGGLIGFCDANGGCSQCVIDADCQADEMCREGVCVKCGDGVQNGNEVCGGSCGKCISEPCTDSADCAGGNCVFTNLSGPLAKVCCSSACDGVCQRCSEVTGFCTNVTQGNQDIDTCNTPGVGCSGVSCKIQNGYACTKNLDCISGQCSNGYCK